MRKREMTVQNWFQLWLTGKALSFPDFFRERGLYGKLGPEYHGVKAIEHWFAEWNTRGRVLAWDIKQFIHQGDQTVVEWYFQCEMNDRAFSLRRAFPDPLVGRRQNHVFKGVWLQP